MIINQVSFFGCVLSHSSQSLSLLSVSPAITHALLLSHFRGSTKICRRSSCKTLASTLLFGWPHGLSHERLFLARAVAGHERKECKKEWCELWLSTRGGGWRLRGMNTPQLMGVHKVCKSLCRVQFCCLRLCYLHCTGLRPFLLPETSTEKSLTFFSNYHLWVNLLLDSAVTRREAGIHLDR